MSASSSTEERIQFIVDHLEEEYGEIDWWDAPPDEVMVGAILTQQTRWENVERALGRLRDENLLSIPAILAASPSRLEGAIRCTGFFRIKTQRLIALAEHVVQEYGSIDEMESRGSDELRIGLLSVRGVGEETADSILCYGFSRLAFVIDAYTRRICRCAGVVMPDSELRDRFEGVLPPVNDCYRRTHAHIVEYAKDHCSKKRCEECSIRSFNG